MTDSLIAKLSTDIRQDNCEWVIGKVLSETSSIRAGLLEECFFRMSEINTLLDLEGQVPVSDLVDMVIDHLSSNKQILKDYSEFNEFFKWLSLGKPSKNNICSTMWGFCILRIIEKIDVSDPESDNRKVVISFLSKAKAVFTSDNSLDKWGLGICYMIQGLLNDNKFRDHSKSIRQKAKELFIESINLEKSTPQSGSKFLIKTPYYTLAKLSALMGPEEISSCLEYVAEAKVRSEIEFVNINDPYFVHVKSKKRFLNGIQETLQESNDRLKFWKEMRSHQENLSLGIAGGGGLKSSLIASVAKSINVNDVLSRSTLDFLTSHNPLGFSINLRAFFQPVKNVVLDEARQRLKERMNLYGMEEKREIMGDGNCQMYSLSDQLTGNTSHHKFIRRELVAWLRDNKDLVLPNNAKLEDFVYNQTWDSYCDDMAKDCTWGDHLTLTAATEVFRIRIFILSSIPDSQFTTEIFPEFETSTVAMLSHLAEFHYGSMQFKSQV
eukprot:TRINITY_DN9490_c0_g1_i1.p1 TRINITY_DN9490_c0_g1~~TRINITY_DN9490_c0_g1_i1.p1  ORF type:complete len:495 (+),score=71.41 TRINITY_DN9490_c0_g1_i1:136-1620(+)